MKRLGFILMTALALAGARPANAQQAQAGARDVGPSGQRRAGTLCHDGAGAAYSAGALIRDAAGDLVRCEGGKWLPAPPSAIGAQAGPRARTVDVARPQAVNVRLELTITDQSGGGQPEKKTITMLLADGFDGRVRSGNVLTDPGTSSRYNVQLNADAAVSLVADDKVRARITVEYEAAGTAMFATSGDKNYFNPPTGLNETVTVILANGKPTVITQSADPATDRKVTLEATATIVR